MPNDQGGKISIQCDRSALDVYPETDIDHYSVWRRLARAVGVLRADSISGAAAAAITGPDKNGEIIYRAGYAWEWLADVPAAYFDTYAHTAMSLYDSTGTDTGWQYFMVRAQTGLQNAFYDSAIDSGYSVDNLSPVTPSGFAGYQISSPVGLRLSWDPNSEDDLGSYSVYRGVSPDFIPEPSSLLFETTQTSQIDSEWTQTSGYYYKLAAIDVHGNQSGYALLEPGAIVATMLAGYSAYNDGSAVEIRWRLSEAGDGITFFVLRKVDGQSSYVELLGQGMVRDDLSFRCRDASVEPGNAYRYQVDVKDETGRRALFTTEPVTVPALSVALRQNSPNPFSKSTMIRYYVPERVRVTLDVYDVAGKKVTRLVDEFQGTGFHTVDWTGRDARGIPVSSGIFVCVLKVGATKLSHKMILVR